MGYGLASSPISLALRARLSPKPIALAGHRHHSACTAYKLERFQSKRDVIDQKIPSENPWLVKSLLCIDMIDYPRKTFKELLGMLTGLKRAFLRMHVGLLSGYSPKIVRKVLGRAFYPLARKNVLALNQMASLARKNECTLKIKTRLPIYSSASLVISEEIQRPGRSKATLSIDRRILSRFFSKSHPLISAYTSASRSR